MYRDQGRKEDAMAAWLVKDGLVTCKLVFFAGSPFSARSD